MKTIIKKTPALLAIVCLLLVFAACQEARVYKIGMSQCSEDDWRSLLNTEVRREARIQGDLDVDIVSANSDNNRQIADIERFINERKDLIVVAPNEADDLRPVIEKAYDAGIPVILIDRKTQGDKYTAFLGANNLAIGRQIGDYIVADAKGRKVKVVQIMGLKGSTPEQERQQGFEQAIAEHTNIEVIASANANWNQEDAELVMDSLMKLCPHIDYIYAHNDRMAKGAYKTLEKAERIDGVKIIGVDALVSDGGGVDMVMEKKFLATYIYPTGGQEAIQLAKRILTGATYQRDTELPAALVDSTNAHVLKLQYQTFKGHTQNYDKLESLTALQQQQIHTQRVMLIAAIIILTLLGIICNVIYSLYKEKQQVNELMMAQIKTLIEVRGEPLQEEDSSPLSPDSSPLSKTETETDKFLMRVKEIIQQRMGNADFTVTDLADELHISRVQLYRKIKAASEINANELIRRSRLEKARSLLLDGEKTVSEVAYEVGFSSPSYFAKCYRDYFGEVPSNRQV